MGQEIKFSFWLQPEKQFTWYGSFYTTKFGARGHLELNEIGDIFITLLKNSILTPLSKGIESSLLTYDHPIVHCGPLNEFITSDVYLKDPEYVKLGDIIAHFTSSPCGSLSFTSVKDKVTELKFTIHGINEEDFGASIFICGILAEFVNNTEVQFYGYSKMRAKYEMLPGTFPPETIVFPQIILPGPISFVTDHNKRQYEILKEPLIKLRHGHIVNLVDTECLIKEDGKMFLREKSLIVVEGILLRTKDKDEIQII